MTQRTISWTPNAIDTEGEPLSDAVTSHNVYVDGAAVANVPVPAASYVHDFAPGAYQVQVAARNAVGTGPLTAAATHVEPSNIPSPPDPIAVT